MSYVLFVKIRRAQMWYVDMQPLCSEKYGQSAIAYANSMQDGVEQVGMLTVRVCYFSK